VFLDSSGVALAIHEWGDPNARSLLLTHGGGEFARSFDVFAPLLAAGGWRVVAWDQRGHGDSEHAPLSSWDADLRDTLAVVESLGGAPLPVIGHSKGGTLMTMFADACPHRVSHVVNLDGFPSKEGQEARFGTDAATLRLRELPAWLDHRRVADVQRVPGTMDELAARRRKVNPRLSMAWLRYLVSVGGEETALGWRWRLDPAQRGAALVPLRPEWGMRGMGGLGVPYLAVLGLVAEEVMSTGTSAAELAPFLPPGGEVVELADSGHFVHIEQPHEVARIILDFLAAHPPANQPAAQRTTRTDAS
jgi:pimeloyl-ACP methyl ester carboxylesterase